MAVIKIKYNPVWHPTRSNWRVRRCVRSCPLQHRM